MTVFLAVTGQRQKPKLINLTTTNDTVVMAGPPAGVFTLDTLTWSAKASGGNLSLWITDGTDSAYLMDAEPKAARSHDIISDWHPILLNSTWSLMAKASAADQFDIIATFIQSGQGVTAGA